MIGWLLLLQQAAPPTVGDTLRLERTLGDVGTAVVRPQPWDLGSLGLQLGPAEVFQGARGLAVRYALVLWFPGDQVLTMPGPVLVRRDGSSDTLPASTYRVSVASVLPAGARRSTLAPKPSRDPVPIVSRTIMPVVGFAGFVLLGLGLVALLWRRRGKAPAEPPSVELIPEPALLQRWAAAGECRAALEGWSWRLARRLAWSRDLEEIAALQRLLDDIADKVFLPDTGGALAQLCERAALLEPR